MQNQKSIKMSLWIFLVVCLSGCAASKPERTIFFPPPPDEPRLQWIGTYHTENDFKRVGMAKAMADITGGGPVDGFDGPIGVAVNIDGRVLVNDLYHQTVKYLDFEKQDIGFLNQHVFRNNLGLATDEQGRIYVADGKARKIMVFAMDGTPLQAIGGEDHLEKPSYLAINHDLGRLYVSDPKASAVKVFGLNGEFLFQFGERGREDGQFNAPQGIAIDSDGRVFVADMLNARIQVFSPDGEYLEQFGSRGTLKHQFETPKDLAFDSEGNLYVVDSRRPNFRIMKPDGRLLLVVGADERTDHKLGFTLPVAIHVDQFDRVFIADLMNRRIAVWQYLSEAYRQRQQSP